MSYVSPTTGKQYVLVTVPDGGSLLQLETQVNEHSGESALGGGYVFAYALPD